MREPMEIEQTCENALGAILVNCQSRAMPGAIVETVAFIARHALEKVGQPTIPTTLRFYTDERDPRHKRNEANAQQPSVQLLPTVSGVLDASADLLRVIEDLDAFIWGLNAEELLVLQRAVDRLRTALHYEAVIKAAEEMRTAAGGK